MKCSSKKESSEKQNIEGNTKIEPIQKRKKNPTSTCTRNKVRLSVGTSSRQPAPLLNVSFATTNRNGWMQSSKSPPPQLVQERQHVEPPRLSKALAVHLKGGGVGGSGEETAGVVCSMSLGCCLYQQ